METPTLTREEIISFTIRLLALEQGVTEDELSADLEAAGPQLPIDSIKVTEVLARVEERYGVKIAASVPAARSMRSLQAFADRILATKAST